MLVLCKYSKTTISMPAPMFTCIIIFYYLFYCSALRFKFQPFIGYHSIRHTGIILHSSEPASATVDTPIPHWFSPEFKESDIKEWFIVANKPLLRVGGRGIQDTHVNSLLELLEHHNHVRVKVSSRKQTARALATQFMDNTQIANGAALLLIKQREILFGRKLLAAV